MDRFDKNVPGTNGMLSTLRTCFGNIPKYSRKFLVDLSVPDPEYYHITLIASRVISEVLKSEPVALVPRHIDPKYVALIQVYGITKLIDLSEIRLSFLTKMKATLFALWSFLVRRSKNGLLKMQYRYCPVGYFIYDTYLAHTGEATVNLFDLRYMRYIYSAVASFYKYEMLFDESRYDLYFASEQSYIGGGISSSVAISKGIRVLVRKGGPSRVSLKLYEDLESLKTWPGHPDLGQYQRLFDSKCTEAIEWADSEIQNWLGGTVDEVDLNAVNAYKNAKHLTKDDLLGMFPDRSKYRYTVAIMSHIFTDAVHGYWDMLFVDYATWLRRTLEIAAKRPDVLWIVKPHPSEADYKLKMTTYDIYKEFQKYKNIRFLPIGLSLISATDTVDAIVTARGTAAIEYSCLGVPAVVAGTSPFDEGEFCTKPENVNEYADLLQHGEFRRLSESKIRRAKVSLYIYKKHMLVDMPFLSNYRGSSSYDDFANHLVRIASSREDVVPVWRTFKIYLQQVLGESD